MRTFWKPAALLLTVSLAATACSTKGGEPSESSSAGSSTAAAGTPDPNKKYKFTMASEQLVPVDPQGELVKYWQEQFNVEFDIWNLESAKYDDLLNLRFAGGEIPDKLLIRSQMSLQKYVDQDLLAEIPLDMLKTNAPHIYESWIKFEPKAFEYAKVNGKIYGIPHLNTDSKFRNAIVYRGDWMKNVGVDKAPETLSELETMLYKFAKEDPDKNGKKDTYGLSKSGFDMVYGAYGYLPIFWSSKDGKLVYGGVQPEMKQALATLSKWYKDGVIDPEFLTGENKGGYWSVSQPFTNGKIGYTGLGYYYHWKPLLFEGDSASNSYLELKKANPSAADALVLGIPVKGPAGKSGVAAATNPLSGNYTGFGKQLSKDPAKMAKLLQVLDGMNADYDKAMTALFGIKGKHWDMNAAQVPVLLNKLTNNDLSKMGGHLQINPLQLPEWSVKRTQPRIDWGVKNQFDKGLIRNELMTVTPSVSKYSAELSKLQEESYISIITGDKPLDYFDEFVAKWKKNGGEQLEKEANEWYATVK